jgi:hypothetical protein
MISIGLLECRKEEFCDRTIRLEILKEGRAGITGRCNRRLVLSRWSFHSAGSACRKTCCIILTLELPCESASYEEKVNNTLKETHFQDESNLSRRLEEGLHDHENRDAKVGFSASDVLFGSEMGYRICALVEASG